MGIVFQTMVLMEDIMLERWSYKRAHSGPRHRLFLSFSFLHFDALVLVVIHSFMSFFFFLTMMMMLYYHHILLGGEMVKLLHIPIFFLHDQQHDDIGHRTSSTIRSPQQNIPLSFMCHRSPFFIFLFLFVLQLRPFSLLIL